jgi:hypothetical protein
VSPNGDVLIALSEEDAAIVKGMLACGDRQHDIAAWFGVNGGRIAEIAAGQRFREVATASPEQLPRAGSLPVWPRSCPAPRRARQSPAGA